MTATDFLRMYGIGVAACLAADLIWLGVVARGFYQRQFGHLMRADVQWVPAVLFYLVYVAALVVFVAGPAVERQSVSRAIASGAFFGLARLCRVRSDGTGAARALPRHRGARGSRVGCRPVGPGERPHRAERKGLDMSARRAAAIRHGAAGRAGSVHLSDPSRSPQDHLQAPALRQLVQAADLPHEAILEPLPANTTHAPLMSARWRSMAGTCARKVTEPVPRSVAAIEDEAARLPRPILRG